MTRAYGNSPALVCAFPRKVAPLTGTWCFLPPLVAGPLPCAGREVKTVEVVPVAMKVFGPVEQSLTPGNLSPRKKRGSCICEGVHGSFGCRRRTRKEPECPAAVGHGHSDTLVELGAGKRDREEGDAAGGEVFSEKENSVSDAVSTQSLSHTVDRMGKSPRETSPWLRPVGGEGLPGGQCCRVGPLWSRLSGGVPIGMSPGVIGVQGTRANSSASVDAVGGGEGRGARAPSSPGRPLCPVHAVVAQTSSQCIQSFGASGRCRDRAPV